jgi:L-amino acid N-acyltransferase YncA
MADAARPGEPPEVRRCAEADLAAVQAIYADHVRSGTGSFEEAPPDLAEMTRRWRTIRAHGLPYLVAVGSGEVLGYAYAAPYHHRPAYRYTVEDSIYVAPGAARRGVGRALLGALIAECETAGCRQMVAVIGDSTNAGSIKLHEAFWFAPVGTLRSVGFKFGRWLDVVTMQRSIDPGDGTPGG